MAIIETITNEWYFAEWCKQAKNRDSDYGHFTVEAAKALQAWFEELSDDIGEDIEFDPVAWCVDYSEYDSLAEAWAERGDAIDNCDDELDNDAVIEWFMEQTDIIMVDGGHVILKDF